MYLLLAGDVLVAVALLVILRSRAGSSHRSVPLLWLAASVEALLQSTDMVPHIFQNTETEKMILGGGSTPINDIQGVPQATYLPAFPLTLKSLGQGPNLPSL